MAIPNTEYINKNEKVLHSIKRTLRVLVAVTIGLCIGLGTLAVLTFDQSNKSTSALCALRHDREKSVAGAKRFLKEHPNGAFGFTAAEIQKSINEQSVTVHSLRKLAC